MKIATLAISLVLLAGGCSPAISPFDQYAYTQTTSIKVDAHDVMELATTEYSTHEKDVNDLSKEIRKIYEYDRNRPKGTKTVQQWDTLMNPDGQLLGGFLKEWKDKGKLGAAYVEDKVTQIGRGFDEIIWLEIGKNKSGN